MKKVSRIKAFVLATVIRTFIAVDSTRSIEHSHSTVLLVLFLNIFLQRSAQQSLSPRGISPSLLRRKISPRRPGHRPLPSPRTPASRRSHPDYYAGRRMGGRRRSYRILHHREESLMRFVVSFAGNAITLARQPLPPHSCLRSPLIEYRVLLVAPPCLGGGAFGCSVISVQHKP